MKRAAASIVRLSAALLVIGLLGACQQMGPTEFGVRFRKLPPAVGGGVSSSLIRPGEMVAVMPWESIYRFDTSPHDVSWGAPRRESKTGHDDYVYTRALDGNEVALAVTIRYRVRPDPEKLIRLVQEVATSDDEVRELVVSVGRADIRTYMNELRTAEFIDTESRYTAVDRVGESISQRLDAPYGIEILQVKLDDFRFERLLRDGTTDASYQERLTQVQKLREDTEREGSRIEAVKAKKQQEFNNAQAIVNRTVAEARGNLKQAELRGNAYYETRANEAKGITARGKAEVEGLIEQVNALSGPGGLAILRLELARQLQKSDAKFVVMGDGDGKQSLGVNRVDTNRLLEQIGVLEALGPERQPAPERQTRQAPAVKESAE